MNIISQTVGVVFQSGLATVSSYAPKFIAGLIILFIGLIAASLLKDLVLLVFKYFRISKWLSTLGVVKEQELQIWPQLLSELVRWTMVFIFLMSAVDLWGIPKVSEVLSQLLLFLPNVIMAVIIGWIGLVLARFAFDIVRHSVRGVGGRESEILGSVARYSIIFFTVLIILNQLGVAAELVKILFTGIVGMLALALGLAFGLGGKEEAGKVLEKLSKKFSK